MADGKGMKTISLAEVAEHKSQEDCWIIIHGKVYDVTKFLDDHPGGDSVIVESSGKDATDEFEDVGHSQAARDQLADFYVGEAEESDVKSFAVKEESKTLSSTKSSSDFIWKLFQIAVPLVLLAAAYYIKVNSSSKQAESV